MTKLDELLRAAESNALRQDATHNDLLDLVAEVGRERARAASRMLDYAAWLLAAETTQAVREVHDARRAKAETLAVARMATVHRYQRALDRVRRLRSGLPAFQPRNPTYGNPSDGEQA